MLSCFKLEHNNVQNIVRMLLAELPGVALDEKATTARAHDSLHGPVKFV